MEVNTENVFEGLNRVSSRALLQAVFPGFLTIHLSYQYAPKYVYRKDVREVSACA